MSSLTIVRLHRRIRETGSMPAQTSREREPNQPNTESHTNRCSTLKKYRTSLSLTENSRGSLSQGHDG
ncbi:MAG: hypothetical protein ACI9D0_001481 [Bacteroidia bacterium]|jgi:hypothetical protein